MEFVADHGAGHENLFGKSDAAHKIYERVFFASSNDLPVLIIGESGTGKSFIARMIHDMSRRADGPFVGVDTRPLSDSGVERELFGYEKGAFDGAENVKKGLVEIAVGGTVFINNAENLPLRLYPKITRVVNEKKLCRFGSNMSIDADVRIIAANSPSPEPAAPECESGTGSLLGMGICTIPVPPLRERLEDMEFFARIFFDRHCAALKKRLPGIAPESFELLKDRQWYGNLRELEDVMRRAVTLCIDGLLQPEKMELAIGCATPRSAGSGLPEDLPALSLKYVEKVAIRRVLDMTKGKRTKAASLLGIDYKTLVRKINEYHIQL